MVQMGWADRPSCHTCPGKKGWVGECWQAKLGRESDVGGLPIGCRGADGMCEGWSEEVRRGMADMDCHDEQTWKKAELDMLKKMGEYEYVYRERSRATRQARR